jgi:hypothetical protein
MYLAVADAASVGPVPFTLQFFSGVGASRPVLLRYSQRKTGRLAPYRFKVEAIQRRTPLLLSRFLTKPATQKCRIC